MDAKAWLESFDKLSTDDKLRVWNSIKAKMDARTLGLEIAKRIAKVILDSNIYEIHSIILFGSYARGDQGPNSDLDLIILSDFNGVGRFERALPLHSMVREETDLPVDLLCFTPEEFNSMFLYRDSAVKEGIVLYEKRRS